MRYLVTVFSLSRFMLIKADSTAAKENTWKQGAYTIYSEVMGDKEITFIGQLPIAAAKRIVEGVTFLK